MPSVRTWLGAAIGGCVAMAAMVMASRAAGASLSAQWWRGLALGLCFSAAIVAGAMIVRWLGEPEETDADVTESGDALADADSAGETEQEAPAVGAAAGAATDEAEQSAAAAEFTPLVPPKLTVATTPDRAEQAVGGDG